MEDMTFSEALKVIKGVVRFQRALNHIDEVLERVIAGNALLENLDRDIAIKETQIAEVNQSLIDINDSLAKKAEILKKNLADIKIKVDDEYAELMVSKKEQIKVLDNQITDLESQAATAQKQVEAVNAQLIETQIKADAASKILEQIQKKKDALLAKFA